MSSKNDVKVLIIEDDQIYRESIQELININERLNCEYVFESCEQAIKAIKGGYVPEIILLDIELPGINGIEGIREFKKISPATKILMLTVFDDNENIFNAICAGAVGYPLKSSSAEQIGQFIFDVLCGGAAMSPSIAAKVMKTFSNENNPKQDYGLSKREKEILKLLVDGYSKKHLAEKLCISYFTVDTHLKNIYAKLQVHSQVDVVTKALRENII